VDLLIDFGKIAVVVALVLLNGFFVAAEFAIVKVRMTQLEPLVKEGVRRAGIAKHVVTHLDTYLSACQLGITITSLALGWVGEPFVARLLSPLLTLVGVTQPALVATISFGVAFGVITFLHIVVGELAPKSLAIQKARQTTLAVAHPLHLFFVIFRPFISFLNASANIFLKMAGMGTATGSEIAHSDEELRILLSRGKDISTTGKGILLRAMELRNRTVREVMVPRTDIVFLSADRTIEENMKIALESQFTRYPLCRENLDNILGMIHLKDLFRFPERSGDGSRLLTIARELPFVPETLALERALNLFLTKRVLMAIAVDEYGGTAGLVTLENVIEELVGEIRDEFDVEPIMVQKVSDSEFVVDGTMPLHDFARMFEFTPISKEVVTVSGYTIHLLGKVPEKGLSFQIGSWTGMVDAVEGKKVKAIRLRRAGGDVPPGV
jgi:CBS domain containing-hemolysin-like protein